MKASTQGLLVSIALVVAGAARAQYDQENWDDPVLQSNGWYYWDENHPGSYPGADEPMPWLAEGGVGPAPGSGHVTCVLDVLTPHHDETRAFFPAYNTTYLDTPHFIDLGIPDAAVKVYLSDKTQPLTPNIDFHGGYLTLFLGQWDNDTGNHIFYYNTTAAIPAEGIPDYWTGATRWREFTFAVGGDSDWAVFASAGGVVPVSSLFYHPQQWGFVIMDDSGGPPTGALGFDSWRIVPEPTVAVLLLMGAPIRRRRR